MNFDLRTAYLLAGLLYLLVPFMVWLVLDKGRSPEVLLWCGGGALLGCAGLLVSVRGLVDDWASYTVANAFLLVSCFMRIQSLRLSLGKPWPLAPMGAVLVLYLLSFEYLRVGLQDIELRILLNSSVTAALLFLIGRSSWQLGRQARSRSARWIAFVYYLAVFVLLVRVAEVLRDGPALDALDPTPVAALVLVSFVLTAIVGNFGYVGIALEASRSREIESAVRQARAEESRRFGEQLAQMDRRRSLGEVSASLAHELTQPLTAIQSNAEVALRGIEKGVMNEVQLRQFFEKIVLNTQRATQIVDRIRSFVRPRQSESQRVDLDSVVRDVLALVWPEARTRGVRIGFKSALAEIPVTGDAIQLSQVVLNICRNALQAAAEADRREVWITLEQGGRTVRLAVHDSGHGLDDETLAKAGTPFFTTKPDGLGMGLSIARGIVQQHGGTLTLANMPDGGALAVVELPAAPARTQQ